MTVVTDLLGKRFGRLVVIEHIGRIANKRGRAHFWRCICDCGQEKVLCGADLRIGDTTSCGCLDKENRARRAGSRTRTHGKTKTPEHYVWDSMIQRCRNPKRKDYSRYGAIGITVCDRWSSFSAFLEDMGPRPSPNHSIERNDYSKPYEPSNCRWATRVEQARNTSANVRVTIDGTTKCLTEWCEVLGMRFGTVQSRRARGWTTEAALTTPPDRRFAHA